LIYAFRVKKPTTRDVVIANIRELMIVHDDTTYALAKRSGLAQSSIMNILSGRHKISVENADAIAAAYGLEGWHLLLRDLPNDLRGSPAISRLVNAYIHSKPEGRQYIDSVAERESKYADNSD